jgi:Flp pilus assembly protein TadD
MLIYRQIAEENPNDLMAQTTYAEQLYLAGRKEETAKLYTALIARSDLSLSQKTGLRRQYARLLIEQGDKEGAMVQMQEVVRADPMTSRRPARWRRCWLPPTAA